MKVISVILKWHIYGVFKNCASFVAGISLILLPNCSLYFILFPFKVRRFAALGVFYRYSKSAISKIFNSFAVALGK